MDEKREKNGETIIILRPGPMHRKKVGEALAAINEVMKEDHDLLVWIKAREMMCKARASKEKAASVYDPERPRERADYPTEASKTLQIGVYVGRAEAYHDTWRQILFPGVSVQDGTLDPETAAKAEEEWTAIAEEVLKNKMGKVLPEKTEEELKEEKRAKLQEELTEAARRNFRC